MTTEFNYELYRNWVRYKYGGVWRVNQLDPADIDSSIGFAITAALKSKKAVANFDGLVIRILQRRIIDYLRELGVCKRKHQKENTAIKYAQDDQVGSGGTDMLPKDVAELNYQNLMKKIENCSATTEYVGQLQKDALRLCLAQLNERDRNVLVWTYYDDLRQTEISKRLGTCSSRVAQLHLEAIAKCKELYIDAYQQVKELYSL